LLTSATTALADALLGSKRPALPACEREMPLLADACGAQRCTRTVDEQQTQIAIAASRDAAELALAQVVADALLVQVVRVTPHDYRRS